MSVATQLTSCGPQEKSRPLSFRGGSEGPRGFGICTCDVAVDAASAHTHTLKTTFLERAHLNTWGWKRVNLVCLINQLSSVFVS